MTDDFEVEPTEEAGQVRIRTDSPGQRAVSAVLDAEEAIQQIAAAAGLQVTIEEEPEEEDEPAQEQPDQPTTGQPPAEGEQPPQAGQLPAEQEHPEAPPQATQLPAEPETGEQA